jgi:F420-dependent oxidoreductase-like protein
MDSERLTIEHVADRTGLSAHTLRYSERIGFLDPIGHATSGHRREAAKDLASGSSFWHDCGQPAPIRHRQGFSALRRQGDTTRGRRCALEDAHQQMVQKHSEELQQNLEAITQKRETDDRSPLELLPNYYDERVDEKSVRRNHSMKYGILLPQGLTMDLVGINDPVEAYEAMTRVAQTADEAGYDSVWLVDHFYTIPQPSQEVTFECWTTTAALARDTKRVRIGQTVTCNGYRNPALLAKMASTVDVLSHGRLNFGIGAGWYEQEYRAYGYEYPDAPERLRLLREALQVILAMWTQEEATFEGKYYQVRRAINQPKGVQKPHIPLLIGGSGEKVTLKLVAQYGDACDISGDLATLKRKFALLKEHCETMGRDYHAIHRTARTVCILADSDEEAIAKTPEFVKAFFGNALSSVLIGSPDTIRQRIADYEAAGVQELRIIFPDVPQLHSIRRFASEFIAS